MRTATYAELCRCARVVGTPLDRKLELRKVQEGEWKKHGAGGAQVARMGRAEEEEIRKRESSKRSIACAEEHGLKQVGGWPPKGTKGKEEN